MGSVVLRPRRWSCRLSRAIPPDRATREPRPADRRTASARPLRQPPQILLRGNARFSTIKTLAPAPASSWAASAPAGPAPMTIASQGVSFKSSQSIADSVSSIDDSRRARIEPASDA